MKQAFKAVAQPAWSVPMLATLTYKPFSDPNWIYERKLDGMRCILHKKGSQVTIWSRNKKKQNNVFPELVTALQKYGSDFILDSEVVTFDGTKTSFEQLQMRMHVQVPTKELLKKVPIVAYVFDIIYLNGYDLSNLPLLLRKKVLQENFKFTAPLKYLPHKVKNGLEYFSYAAKHGWEGLIAKQADSVYVHQRSKSWLKFKCDQGQEFVIGGYTQPRGHRVKFGALLIGYYKNGMFKYAGKVGTGFDVATLKLLHAKMHGLQITISPFSDYANKAATITWLKPKLIAEVGFTEWTSEGHLRHPRYLGLRIDKKATQVVKE